MKTTFMSFSFGCRVNEAEKQTLDRELFENGFVWDEHHPDFYIINTCAITGKAEREVRQHIYQIRKKFPKTKIVATGCSATLWKNNHTLLPEVDYWFGNTEKSSIPATLSSGMKHTGSNIQNMDHDKFLHSGKVVIKIQDGCNRFCSYCIVPYTRGRATSKTVADVIDEIKTISFPINELILTGINTEYFGIGTNETLIDLLDAILGKTDVPRISFGSIHPWSITDEFIHWYGKNKENPRFVHFFHIPIQSGSDTILRLMNRPYQTKTILNQLQKLHAVDPHALIATDVIVGFPGEGQQEFEETYTFLEKSPITKFHVFRYSERPGTAAQKLENTTKHVFPETKKERAKKLTSLSILKSKKFLTK